MVGHVPWRADHPLGDIGRGTRFAQTMPTSFSYPRGPVVLLDVMYNQEC